MIHPLLSLSLCALPTAAAIALLSSRRAARDREDAALDEVARLEGRLASVMADYDVACSVVRKCHAERDRFGVASVADREALLVAETELAQVTRQRNNAIIRADRMYERAAKLCFETEEARATADACYETGWRAIVERDEAYALNANMLAHCEGHVAEKALLRARAEAAEKARAEAAQQRDEARCSLDWAKLDVERLKGERNDALARALAAEGRRGDMAKVTKCAACDGKISDCDSITCSGTVLVDGIRHRLCRMCFTQRGFDIVQVDIRARHAARAASATPVAVVEPFDVKTICDAAQTEVATWPTWTRSDDVVREFPKLYAEIDAKASTDALCDDCDEEKGHAPSESSRCLEAPTQDDLGDAAVPAPDVAPDYGTGGGEQW